MSMALVPALAAHADIATSGLATIGRLAARSGADDVVLPALARNLDDVKASLLVLQGREAQAVIGPAVNIASQARVSVGMIGTTVASGGRPAASLVADAAQLVQRVASRIAAAG